MAVARLSKLFIISHKSDTEAVLKKLQRAAVSIEVSPYTGSVDLNIPESGVSREHNIEVKRALGVLDLYKESNKEKIKKTLSRAGKLVIKRSEYESTIKSGNIEGVINNILETGSEIENLNEKIEEARPKIKQLEEWACYRGKIENIGETDTYTIKLGIVKHRENGFEEIEKNLGENNIECEKISSDKTSTRLILAYHNMFKSKAEEFLGIINFEEAKLEGYTGTISENLSKIRAGIDFDEGRKANLRSELKKISDKHEKALTVHLDYIENNLEIEDAVRSGFSTESVSFHTAWVNKSDVRKVFSIIEGFKSARVVEVQPDKDESIPVMLENKPIFRPFEIVVDLYGVPRYFEIDPTPFVAIFFPLFFGLCLTDAGYGVILAVVALVFAYKMKSARKFLMLIFAGALFSIFAGAIFNGWFGDLPGYLGLGGFFSKMAILGDPVKSNEGSMNFFRLALALGVIQVVFGLFINFFDRLRHKDWAAAFFDGLPWIIIIIPLLMIVLSSQIAVNMQLVSNPIFPAGIGKILIWPIIIGAVMIILFSARDMKGWGLRLFLGVLNLTIVNGLTSFLGDFLSYIRLMALGLVTAGIGVAINTIAFQLSSVPVVGIVILIIILVFGHIANIVINVLGSFVHTLRLQYVEFFPKFYTGGGRPFRNLRDEHKYVTIID
jgi:V/A-type H+/Na+-transporting ATPase subunit I